MTPAPDIPTHIASARLSGLNQLRALIAAGKRPGIAESLDLSLIEIEDRRLYASATSALLVMTP